jgi:hypothetical protein
MYGGTDGDYAEDRDMRRVRERTHVREAVRAMRDLWELTCRRHVDLVRVSSALCRAR